MVANVLIINDAKTDVVDTLKKHFCAVKIANNFEKALRVVRSSQIDVVLMFLSKDFNEKDFFRLFRQVCGIIPIIGVVDSLKNIPEIPLDDVVEVGLLKNIVMQKVEMFAKIKNQFETDVINTLNFDCNFFGKIAVLLHSNYNFIDKKVRATIVETNDLDHLDADLFIINGDKHKAKKLCAELRLRHISAPIIVTYTSPKKAAFFSDFYSLGCTSIVPERIDPKAFSYQITSLIKFKKVYDIYVKNIKEQMYNSIIDATTGVYNRAFLEEYIKRYNITTHNSAIFMIDVDKFKTVNDRFGHSFGDKTLNVIAKIIKKNIRSSDIVARYGGDEFIVIMQNVTTKAAQEVAERIQKCANFEERGTQLSVSIGLCCDEYIPIKEAIAIADRFMYIVKQNGGNNVRMCA